MSNPKCGNTGGGSPGGDGDADGEADAENDGCMDMEGHEDGKSGSSLGLEQVAQQIAKGQLSYVAAVKKRRNEDSQMEMGRWRRPLKQQAESGEEVNLSLHSLISLCKEAPCSDESCVEAPLSPSSMAEWLEDSMRMGVTVFFMAKHVKGLQVRNWVRAISGGEDPLQIIFLGRSCFYIKCRDYQQKFSLLSRTGVWAENLFGIPLPWEESFDPTSEFSAVCPVWILLKNMPIFLLSHVEEALLALGKVLYFPKFGPYIHSRSFKVCVLWHLDKAIPAYLRIPVTEKESLFIQILFDPFPLACFKCNRMGHYAKVCPAISLLLDTEKNLAVDNPPVKSIDGVDSLQETQPQEVTQPKKKEMHDIFYPSSEASPGIPLLLTATCRNDGTDLAISKTSNPFEVLTNGESMDDSKAMADSKVPFGTFNGSPSPQGNATQTVGNRNKKRKLKKKKKNNKCKMESDKENLNPTLYVELYEEMMNGNIVEEDLPTQEDKNTAEETSNKIKTDLEGDLYVELNPDLVAKEETSDWAIMEVKDMTKIDNQGKISAEEEDGMLPQQNRQPLLDRQWFKRFYKEEFERYFIPVGVSETDDDTMVTFGGKTWDIVDFFTSNSLDPSEVVFVTDKGPQVYKGSLS